MMYEFVEVECYYVHSLHDVYKGNFKTKTWSYCSESLFLNEMILSNICVL